MSKLCIKFETIIKVTLLALGYHKRELVCYLAHPKQKFTCISNSNIPFYNQQDPKVFFVHSIVCISFCLDENNYMVL